MTKTDPSGIIISRNVRDICMRNDQIFVLMLVILLPMSGCFDGAVGDAEGTEDILNLIQTSNSSTLVQMKFLVHWILMIRHFLKTILFAQIHHTPLPRLAQII